MKTRMKAPTYRALGRMAPHFVADFDSSTGMLRALANFLRGDDFPGMGISPNAMKPVARSVNALPRRAREQVYIWSGWGEAIPPDKLRKVRAEEFSRWVENEYPRRAYPSVAVGASNGAAVHLCAALGIPWLPQTFLIPVRRFGVHPDEPQEDLQWGKAHGRVLLDGNPELQLHHMHDPNQDRLMIQRMTYFRVKRRVLGGTYERFLKERLEPGGTILLLDCRVRWPVTEVGDRHYFQFGAMGGLTPEEYHRGSPQVEAYLTRYGSYRKRWDPPPVDTEKAEAEWGLEPALGEDVERFAAENGYAVRRIAFESPEHLSPLVANLYRAWYEARGIPANRLLVESFLLTEPHWTLRTGSVPFWTKFPVEPDAAWLEQYLDSEPPYDEIYAILFSHGTESAGLARIERWREILDRARDRGDFVGVDTERFPRDFAVFIRYNTDLKKTIPARYPLPGPLSLEAFEEFVSAMSLDCAVIDGETGAVEPAECLPASGAFRENLGSDREAM